VNRVSSRPCGQEQELSIPRLMSLRQFEPARHGPLPEIEQCERYRAKQFETPMASTRQTAGRNSVWPGP
jgi:hypothetical protein